MMAVDDGGVIGGDNCLQETRNDGKRLPMSNLVHPHAESEDRRRGADLAAGPGRFENSHREHRA